MDETEQHDFWRAAKPNPQHSTASGEIACCDALDLLKALADNCADIIFLDPPFNLGKEYGSKRKEEDLIDESEYREFMTGVLMRSVEVLKPGAALYLYHLPYWAFQFANILSEHLHFRHWIAISMKNGFARGDYLYPAHYALVYFTKGNPRVFSRPKIPAPRCRHCEGYIKDYGGYEKYIKNGINLSDIWDDLSPVRHPKNKTRNANELPPELPRRVIEMSGTPNGLFVDPFAGSGTTLVEAQKSGMRFAASDHDQQACELAASRIGSEVCI